MGNEQAQLPGIEIEEKAIEVSDFWSLHSASILNSEHINNLSVFIGELFVNGTLWSLQTPLEKCSKNLMIYRHPCILKYISSWKKNSKFYLAVEDVTPLSHILPQLDTLQICIGLHSILKALHFLHEKASTLHNNICIASIYVKKDDSWKLGGMEYLCRYKDLTCDYLNKSRTSRYNKAVDPNEHKLLQDNLGRKDFVDIYGFGVLACEILKLKNDDDFPTLSAFLEYCRNDLQTSNLSERPTFSSILQHDFFNHEFIIIHSFLVELPLKSDEEKTQFFQNLGERLKRFDEVVIASQLSGLLLSRMVLLNKIAQDNLLPLLLTPRHDKEEISDVLFSVGTFKKYLSPKLLEIISVRDAQIRLLLLRHFSNFMHTFTKEELQSCILPELLVGIKDTNDRLVSATLRTLAELVPVLGATTVIGGKRARLFNDGRPTHPTRKVKFSRSHGFVQPVALSSAVLHDSLAAELNNLYELPERPRPDGEEGETSTDEIEQSVDEDLDNWEDWDINENNHYSYNHPPESTRTGYSSESENIPNATNQMNVDMVIRNENSTSQTDIQSKRLIQDISELDIKNQLNSDQNNEDFNFFQDMEPVIDTSNKFLINESKCDIILDLNKELSSKLALNINDINEDGWGDGDWE